MEESFAKQIEKLRRASEEARQGFTEFHVAREEALRLSRDIIRNSANAIRATHRGEFEKARELVALVKELTSGFGQVKSSHPAVYYAGYVEDALKEYVEACATLAFAEGTPLPLSEELGVGPAPYLGGLADTAGELRRFILDSLRQDDFSRCEQLLEIMDEIYSILITMDFPDAVTRGLRRNTDMVRGVLERTRGDLTIALRQRRLEERLSSFDESS